jgi:hypothetical protein
VEATSGAACKNASAAAAAAAAGCYVSVGLRMKILRKNMGQGKSEGQDFKRD